MKFKEDHLLIFSSVATFWLLFRIKRVISNPEFLGFLTPYPKNSEDLIPDKQNYETSEGIRNKSAEKDLRGRKFGDLKAEPAEKFWGLKAKPPGNFRYLVAKTLLFNLQDIGVEDFRKNGLNNFNPIVTVLEMQ